MQLKSGPSPLVIASISLASLWMPNERLGAWQSAGNGGGWLRFRGEHGQGVVPAAEIPRDLADSANLRWKADVPGRGWSSPIILENEIWMTTAIESSSADPHEVTNGKETAAPPREQRPSGPVSLKAVCLDRETGELRRTVDLFEITEPPPIHPMNSFASPSPVADDARVYCHFGTFGTAAIARSTGEVVWRNTENVIDHETGPGSSPILHNGLLIFHCDGTDQQYLCALDCETGHRVWATDRSGEMEPVGMYRKAFCTPLVIERHGRNELISPAANWVYAYDPDSGQELWRIPYGVTGFSVVTLPLVAHETLYICTSFMESNLLAIDLTREGPLDESAIKWRYKGQVPNMPTPLIVGDQIYLVSDRGVMTCLDALTGEKRWQDRLGKTHSSSPLLVDGRILVGDHDGILYGIAPDANEMKLEATFPLDSQIMATPACAGNRLFVRTRDSLYCFGNPDGGP